MHFLPFLISTFIATSLAHAGEAEIRKAVQTLAPGVVVKQISKTPLNGMQEVTLDSPKGPMVVYAHEKGDFLLIGDLLDVKNRRNLTEERMNKLTEVKWDSLPLQNAVKVIKGNGKRKMAVFSDLDCPYCKKLEVELAKIDNVTIYNFAYPLPMHPDAERKSRLIWCSKDRAAAWNDYMRSGKLPDNKGDCDNPVDENLALGAKLRIDGTPAILFPNGKRLPGYVPAEQLDAKINASQ